MHVKESQVRIIRGSLRGRYVRFIEADGLRPTLNRVREAVMSMCCDWAPTHGFIDLCAGSGSMGFEAYSVGFSPVLLVESQEKTAAMIRENAEELEADVTLIQKPAKVLLRMPKPTRPMVVYADPSYRERSFHEKFMAHIQAADWLPEGSVYIAEAETPFKGKLPEGWIPFKSKQYGRVHLDFFAVKKFPEIGWHEENSGGPEESVQSEPE